MIDRGAALLASTLLLGGCAFGPPPEPGPVVRSSPSPVRPDAGTALADGWVAVKSYSYRFTSRLGDGRILMTGAVESGGRDSEAVLVTTEGRTTIRRIQNVNYARVADGGWTKLENTADIDSLSRLDPARLHISLETATGVRWVDDDTVTGDFDAAETLSRLGADPAETARMAGRKFPFEASLDIEGRLVEYRNLATADGPGTSTRVIFSDFGAPIDVVLPPL